MPQQPPSSTETVLDEEFPEYWTEYFAELRAQYEKYWHERGPIQADYVPFPSSAQTASQSLDHSLGCETEASPEQSVSRDTEASSGQ